MAIATTEDSQRLRIGVDSGGTFTDICLFDETNGEITVWKVSSTPGDPSLGIAGGVAQGMAEVTRQSGKSAEVSYFGHGTTVATNALIVGRGSATGMITTAGFRDVLELRRQTRDSLYDLQTEKPTVLVARNHRLEVGERVCFDGSVMVALDEQGVRQAARRLREEGMASVAICFLFSYLAPEHELRARRIVLEEMPGAFVSVSHEVAPEMREYERFSTTVVNAYLGPLVRNYLQGLQPRLQRLGIAVPVQLTQSNGGIISSAAAQAFPARTVLSGPAAGVTGALAIGKLAGYGDIITFDMGGTSTDVSLINGGRPRLSTEAVVHGYPLKLPMLDIHTVGAGGGSIAHIDAGGLLKVGPRSAGADPGPICYGLGNTEATVTDANVVLQILNPTHLLNGRLPIDRQRSVEAITRLGEDIGLGVMETAQGIISIVVANMAKAIRVISVERGYDPRDFVMFGFGGAGPIHAARLARALDMPKVIIPKFPGIMCALGLLLTDLKSSFSAALLRPLASAAGEEIRHGYALLEDRAGSWFNEEHIGMERRRMSRSLDLRYAGQGHELTVACSAGAIDENALMAIRQEFEQAHRQAYGYVADDEPVQITALRLEAVGIVAKAAFPRANPVEYPVDGAVMGRRQVWMPEAGGFTDCPIYDRTRLGFGHCFQGPAIVDQMDSTTLVLPGQTATVDGYLNLVIEE